MAGLLENKVVVISGVGPALGTTLARRCAEAGADLVLAARTVERLDDVAKQITGLGRRAVSVGTDITDEAQVSHLVEESLKAYGKVDVLINNAFRVPSMRPLADTTFEHMRDAIELTVFGALRMIQGFTPALAEAGGSIVNVNSMVVRHSQAKYGAYKMAKSALLAMSQSLATELGEQEFASIPFCPAISGVARCRVTSNTRRANTAPASTTSTRRRRSTATSSACPPRTRWPRPSCSWRAISRTESPARRWT